MSAARRFVNAGVRIQPVFARPYAATSFARRRSPVTIGGPLNPNTN